MTPEGGVRQSQVLTLCDLDFSEPQASSSQWGRAHLPGSEITSAGSGMPKAVTNG